MGKPRRVGTLLLSLMALIWTAGCEDAIRNGFTDGLSSAVAGFVEETVGALLSGLTPGGGGE
jgi:hypothetical protein